MIPVAHALAAALYLAAAVLGARALQRGRAAPSIAWWIAVAAAAHAWGFVSLHGSHLMGGQPRFYERALAARKP